MKKHPVCGEGVQDASLGGADDDDILEGRSPEEFAQSTFTTRHTLLFKRQLAAGRVLWCPACYCDWSAMARLSDLVRVFVFCTDGASPIPASALSLRNCPEKLGRLFTAGATGELDTHNIQDLRRRGWCRRKFQR